MAARPGATVRQFAKARLDGLVRLLGRPGSSRDHQDAADSRALLAQGQLLRMPTLGIDGEQDGRLSTATLAQIAADVRGTLIPDCKHWIPEEQPEALAQVLLEFFAQSSSLARIRDRSIAGESP